MHNFAARSRGVSTVYLHDVMFETDPQWFTALERAYFSRMVAWVRRADVVFSSSAAKARSHRAAHARPTCRAGRSRARAPSSSTARRSPSPTWRRGYLLTVGRLNVRKNLGRTIAGVLASGVVSPGRPLVVVGSRGGRDEALAPEAEAAVADGRVRFLGHVSEAHLRWLYAQARLFCFLSLGEGFGMPPSRPSPSARRSSPATWRSSARTCRRARSFVDPLDVTAVADAVREAVADPAPDLARWRAPSWSAHDWRRSVDLMRATVAGLLEDRRRA